MSTCLSPPGKCHMVLCFTKETKQCRCFFCVRSKGSWLSQGGSLLASEANNLASSTPNMRYWESTQTLHQQYHFFRPILHKHTFYIKDPLSHPPFLCPPPFRHSNHHLSMLPQLFRQGSTRVKYRDCNTHLAHCNYSCLVEFAFPPVVPLLLDRIGSYVSPLVTDCTSTCCGTCPNLVHSVRLNLLCTVHLWEQQLYFHVP